VRSVLQLTCPVFIGTEIQLDIGFSAAQARLANLARGGLLRRVSHDAYDEWGAGLARVGPLGAAPGMSRLVRVEFRDLVARAEAAVLALRWEATGAAGGLFPVLDADITLAPGRGRQHCPDGVRGLPAAAGHSGRGTGPGRYAPGRRGGHPGLCAAHRDLPRASCCFC